MERHRRQDPVLPGQEGSPRAGQQNAPQPGHLLRIRTMQQLPLAASRKLTSLGSGPSGSVGALSCSLESKAAFPGTVWLLSHLASPFHVPFAGPAPGLGTGLPFADSFPH